jgi:hypothetical protein
MGRADFEREATRWEIAAINPSDARTPGETPEARIHPVDLIGIQLVMALSATRRSREFEGGSTEFVFRFDRRWKEAELFPRVLHCAIDTDPFPYRHLTADRTGSAEICLLSSPHRAPERRREAT